MSTSLARKLYPHASISQRMIRAILPIIPAGIRVHIYKLCARVSGLIYGTVTGNVFRLPFGLVLKVTFPSSVESHALRFVNRISGVHTPLFIDSVRTAERSYMISTWVEGQRLGDVWDDMTIEDKEQLASDLHQQFSTLRSHTMSTTHPICNAAGGPIDDPRIPWVTQKAPRIFNSCPEFAQEVWIGLNGPRNRDTLRPILQPLIDRQNVPVVFSHGDLVLRNVIVPGGLLWWRTRTERVCLVDWEFAGWMPTYWDPLKATWLDFEEDSEWKQIVRHVFPDCVTELDADWEWRSRSNITII
ncbi:hypothetical protein EIP86_009920 [Pleurotus ostreatoroseus]|nr:hypothetical protein EIP86_009920 [Pleurotus ostreatoroseus]